MTATNLEGLKTKDLLSLYNARADKPLKSWKGSVEKLRAKVLVLVEDMPVAFEDQKQERTAVEEAEADLTPSEKQARSKVKAQKGKGAKAKPAKATAKPRGKTSVATADFGAMCDKAVKDAIEGKVFHTVREMAETLICVSVHKNADKRDVGLPYDRILSEVLGHFPKNKTTKACLRWYGVRLRRQPNVRIPMIRPRNGGAEG